MARKIKKKKKFLLEEFSILHNSKFMATLYFIVSIPIAGIFGVMTALAPSGKAPFSPIFALVLPFVYAIASFVFSAVAFAIYNWVADFMSGGIEFTVEES